MILYDFIVKNDADYDTYDDVYDASVTVSINTEPEDDYDEFCIGLSKLVEVKEINHWGDLICGWSDLISNNMSVFRKFANEHWIKGNYADKDDFICEWIKELHMLLAGYGEDGMYWFYKKEIVDKCKPSNVSKED